MIIRTSNPANAAFPPSSSSSSSAMICTLTSNNSLRGSFAVNPFGLVMFRLEYDIFSGSEDNFYMGGFLR